MTRNAWPSQIKGWQVPVPSSLIQRPLLLVSHVLTSLVAKGPSCPAWDTEVKEACLGPQEAHSSWRTQSHKPLHYREYGTREETAQARVLGCERSALASSQGPEDAYKQQGAGAGLLWCPPQLQILVVFSRQAVLLD